MICHPLQGVVDSFARQVYEATTRATASTQSKEFSNLCREAMNRGDNVTAHASHADEADEDEPKKEQRHTDRDRDTDETDCLSPCDSEDCWQDCLSNEDPAPTQTFVSGWTPTTSTTSTLETTWNHDKDVGDYRHQEDQEDLWHDCLSEADFWAAQTSANGEAQMISTSETTYFCKSEGENVPAMDINKLETVFDHAEDEVWYDCCAFDSIAFVPGGQTVACENDDDNDDMWYDCLLGNVVSTCHYVFPRAESNDQQGKVATNRCSQHSDAPPPQSINGASDPFDNRDRFLNMTDKVLPDRLVNILNNVPILLCPDQ